MNVHEHIRMLWFVLLSWVAANAYLTALIFDRVFGR